MRIPKTIKTDERIFRITNFDGDTFLCNLEHIELEDLDQIKVLHQLWDLKFESYSKLHLRTTLINR